MHGDVGVAMIFRQNYLHISEENITWCEGGWRNNVIAYWNECRCMQGVKNIEGYSNGTIHYSTLVYTYNFPFHSGD